MLGQLNKRAAVAFVAMLGLLVFNAALACINTLRVGRNEQLVAHTHEGLTNLSATLATMADAETGMRGFLITGEPVYLEPYDEALRTIDADLEKLRDLTVGNPEQQERLEALQSHIKFRLEIADKVIQTRKHAGLEASRKVVAPGTGKRTMDAIRRIVGEMEQTENELLAQRAAESRASLRMAIGSTLLASLVGVAMVGLIYYLVNRGLAERRRAAERLRQQREWLEVTLASIGDAVITTDTRGRVSFLNPVAERLTGWKQTDAADRPLAEVFCIRHEGSHQPVESPVEKVLREGRVVALANRTILIAKDGSERPIDDSAAPIRGADGTIAGVVLVCRDVSKRQQEERVRAQLAAIVESSDDAIISESLAGHVVSWNRGAERIFGYTAAEAIGMHVDVLLPADSQGHWQDAGLGAAPYDRATPLETIGQRKNGQNFEMSVMGSAIVDEAGQTVGVAMIARDISERSRLETLLQQSQKMEGIGRLAGGIAHDFNNLLTVIVNYTELMLEDLPPDHPFHMPASTIAKACERATGLTRQLLAFSRKQFLEPEILDLNSVVGEMKLLLHRLIGEDIELSAVLRDDLRPIKADPGQVEQVIMNLAVNARDAMPLGGHLTIETANTQLDAAYADSHPEVQPGEYVMLAVTDSGSGIDQQTQAHIFEPFFTTKEVGKGTGLGLATVYGIVKQSGGSISVYSEVGHGTTFKIYFPVVEGPVSRARPVVRTPTFHGTEVILLVEDEEQVRRLASLILSSAGYTVLEAADGQEALARAQGYSGAIDLLITDVVMPKTSGRRLAEQLIQSRPELQVLYMSGYTDDTVVRHGILEQEIHFLPKPFTPSALLSKVEEILDPARQTSAAAAIPPAKSSYRVLVVDDQQDVAESIAVLVQLWGHDVRVAHDDAAAMSLAAEFNPHMMLIDIHLGGLSGHHLPGRLRKAGLLDHKLLVAMTGQGEESADRSRSFGFDEHISKPASVAVLQGLFAHGKLARH